MNTAATYIKLIKILFVVHFKKNFKFWPSADVKPMSNDPVHAISQGILKGEVSLYH